MKGFSGLIRVLFTIVVTMAAVVMDVGQVESAAIEPEPTSPPPTTTVKPERLCRRGYVCGWEVYDSYTRNLEYYIAAKCNCDPREGTTCIRKEDDPNVSAYVYRCEVRIPTFCKLFHT